MTKALALPENQVRAILRAARKEGVRVEVKIGGAVVTVLPDEEKVDNSTKPEIFDTLEDYMAWRDRSRAGAD